jgi:hypothetical protein
MWQILDQSVLGQSEATTGWWVYVRDRVSVGAIVTAAFQPAHRLIEYHLQIKLQHMQRVSPLLVKSEHHVLVLGMSAFLWGAVL